MRQPYGKSISGKEAEGAKGPKAEVPWGLEAG